MYLPSTGIISPSGLVTLNEKSLPLILPSLMVSGSPWSDCAVPVTLSPSALKTRFTGWPLPSGSFTEPVHLPERPAMAAKQTVKKPNNASVISVFFFMVLLFFNKTQHCRNGLQHQNKKPFRQLTEGPFMKTMVFWLTY